MTDSKRKRRTNFIIFFSIVLSLYALVNFYILIRGWQALQLFPDCKIYYLITYLVLALAYIAGRILERKSLNSINTLIVWLGSLWLAAMVYYLFAVIVIDIFKLIYFLIPGFHLSLFDDPKYNIISFVAVNAVVIITVLGGYINAVHPRIKKLDIIINKNAGRYKEIKAALVTDIHMGTIISHARLTRIVRLINSIDADIVLLAGDVVDEDIKPVIKYNLGEILKQIKSKQGVFAITGNHEYIGGAESAVKYLTEHGLIELRDSVYLIDNSFYLIGREDRSARGFGGKKRKELTELMKSVDKSFPILLMDHQPVKLNEAEENGIDLQVSGHTHHGQLWPFNFITKRVYELSYGYMKKGSTQYYVSCGVGTWGPPVRSGNRPEVVYMNLKYNK
jgi:predicted MPP superfamily phosphohydrolase